MVEKNFGSVVQCGPMIYSQEIVQIQETVKLFPRLSLKELTATISEHVCWYTATGNRNEYLGRYYPLGYKKPFGYQLCYFFISRHCILGCLIFERTAEALTARDRWIGWNESHRLRNLPEVINNNRFLFLPGVYVKYLSAHLLALLSRYIDENGEYRGNYRTLLFETFVGLAFEGSCYKAVGRHYPGMTAGTALVRKGNTYSTTPKEIFVKPFLKDFPQRSCSERKAGRTTTHE